MKPEDFIFCPRCAKVLEKTEDGLKCLNCSLKIYPHSSETASVLLIDRRKVLLTKRSIEPFKGKYDAIGGFLKYAEDPVEGVIREAKEETGLDIKIIELLGVYMDTYGEEGESTFNLYYIGEIVSGKMKANDDVESLEWFSVDELPTPAFKSQKKVLEDLKKWYLGRVRATTIELCKPLADALISNWDYTKFDNRLLDMAFLIQSQNQYNVMYEH